MGSHEFSTHEGMYLAFATELWKLHSPSVNAELRHTPEVSFVVRGFSFKVIKFVIIYH
jgi:hypothetical protein